jgi:hypothetical protein
MSNDNISETVKELLAEADQKTNELEAELKEQKKKAPEAGTAEHRAYTKKLGRLKAKYISANSISELLFDMDDFNEELNQQRRTAEAVTTVLSDWIKEKEAVEQQLTDGGEREALRDQLDAIDSKLEHYASKIGDGSISRIDRYESIIAEASQGEDKKRAREEDDARGDKMAKPSATASPKSARGGGRRGGRDRSNGANSGVGNLQESVGNLQNNVGGAQEGTLHADERMQARARKDRLASLRGMNAPRFLGKQKGEWVLIPGRPQPGDHVIVVEAKASLAEYVGRVGIWRGANGKVDSWFGDPPLGKPQRFEQSCLRIVVQAP